MERLTLEETIKYIKEVVQKNKRNKEKNTIIIPNSFISSDDCAEKYNQVAKWLEELKTYKGAEEQGLLVRLPCKVGDDVYIIPSPSVYGLNVVNGYEKNNKVYHQHVGSIVFADGHWYMTSREEYGFCHEKVLNDIAYGITWFTDREEAEKKLEEMKNDKT